MIKRLALENFRNHHYFERDIDSKYVIIKGPNGIGKTNILEAISFLSPGKGLRAANVNEITKNKANTPWIAYFELDDDGETYKIGTSYSAAVSRSRAIKINEQNVKRQSELLQYTRVLWFSPHLDNIFLETPSFRRKFIDRITFNFYSSHASTVAKYEMLVRSRQKLLNEGNYDPLWLNSLEQMIVETGIIINETRLMGLKLLNEQLNNQVSPFLKNEVILTSFLENQPSLNKDELKVNYLSKLKESRFKDSRQGKCSIGPHKCDIIVNHPEKNINASLCSTGEQKLLLLSILLAEIRVITYIFKRKPIVLLDEIFAFLDEKNTNLLANELKIIPAQIWITTSESEVDSLFPGDKQVIKLA